MKSQQKKMFLLQYPGFEWLIWVWVKPYWWKKPVLGFIYGDTLLWDGLHKYLVLTELGSFVLPKNKVCPANIELSEK